MIALLDTSEDLDVASSELGMDCEELLTPLTRRTPKRPEGRFAIDNGGYSEFKMTSFLTLLEREKPRRDLCRFVCMPDIVGSARRTLECFEHWRRMVTGWPIALVVQDGQEELPIPWDNINAVFIGGTTDWKMSPNVVHIVKAAKILGKWVHAGRVNTPSRVNYFEDLGADSIDGTGISRYSHMRIKVRDYDKSGELKLEGVKS